MKNNNEQTNGKSNGAEKLFQPTIIINIPVKASKAKIQEVLSLLEIDAPLPPLTQIDQINLQLEVSDD